jgi:hypothetical protein
MLQLHTDAGSCHVLLSYRAAILISIVLHHCGIHTIDGQPGPIAEHESHWQASFAKNDHKEVCNV